MPAKLTPGLAFIVRVVLPSLFLPSLICCGIYPLLQRNQYTVFGLHLASMGIVRLGIVIVIVQTFVNRIRKSISQYQDMQRLGAEPVPMLREGYLPGNLAILLEMAQTYRFEYPGQILQRLKGKYGNIVNLCALWEDMIWSDDPTFIKEILATDFPNFIKGERLQRSLYSMLGTGIFNSDGDTWKMHRAMTRPYFHRDRITDFDIFDHHTDITMDRIEERCRTGEPIDFQDMASRFTMDSATAFLFGASVDSLSSPLLIHGQPGTPKSESGTFSSAFKAVMERLADRIRLMGSAWELFEIFGDKTRPDMAIMNAFIDPIIDKALNTKGETADAPETFLAHLAAVTDDKQMIRDQLLNILIAARDTTAATLTFIVYLLSTHDEVFLRLKQEVSNVVGPSQRPTFDHIRDMKYLRAVINETLRLFPPVPFNFKESIESRAWTDPQTGKRYYIPANTRVVYSPLTMGRDTRLWGPDANDFSPDRWFDDRKAGHLANPFIFVPFQAGPRICVGQQFGYNEISFFIVRLLQRFDTLSLAPEAQPEGTLPPAAWKDAIGRKSIEKIMPKCHVTMYVSGGLWMRLGHSVS